MTVLLAALVIVAIPFLAVTVLLKLTERLQDRRDLARDRQVELTDAIHWELGAVAAPVVRQRLDGGWQVAMAVPLERSAEVAALVRLTARHFSGDTATGRLEIVLRPAAWSPRSIMVASQESRPVNTDRPLAA